MMKKWADLSLKSARSLFLSGAVLLMLACTCSNPDIDFTSIFPWFGPTATEPTYWDVSMVAPTERAEPTAMPTVTRRPTRPNPTRTPNAPSCYGWSDVSITDVGSTMCVQGIIQSEWWDSSQGAYFITFSSSANSYYIVLYGWRITNLTSGDCVRSTAEIRHLGDSPVMIIDAYELKHCTP